MRKEDCYFLGKIVRRHGLKGNVILRLDTDQPEQYNKLESVFVEVNGLLVPFFIEQSYWSSDLALNLLFKNVSDEMVDQLIGSAVYLPLSTLPALGKNQFYYHEVTGFSILDKEGRDYGVIREVNDDAPQPYFILDQSGHEVLVPVVAEWILDVNRAEKKITMDLPEGLLDLYTSAQK